MLAVRRFRAPRSLLVVVALAVTMPVLVVPGAAAAGDEVAMGDTVVGEFAQVWPEYENPDEAAEHGDEGPLSYVHTEDGDAVRVDTEDVEGLEVGATVELTVGREVSDTASEDLGYAEAREVVTTEVLESAPAPGPTAPATAPFTNSVTVVMVNPAGGVRDATRLADVVAEVNGPVADFWEAESNGAIKIGVAASRDWIDTKAGCTNPFALWDEVRSRIGGLTGTGARHLMLYVSSTPENLAGCSYGLGTVGGGASWGGSLYARAVKTSLIAHEFGHNFGLGHSSSLQCDASVHDYDGGSFYKMCGRTPYWDLYDVMGASWDQLGSLNVAQARKLFGAIGYEWFEQSTPPATVTLSPVSQQAGTRTIMLWNAKGIQYVLEYRPAVGRDAWLGSTSDNWPGLQSGVLLRQQASGDDTSLLLDATPSPYGAWDDDNQVALPVGTPVRVYDDFGTGGAAFVITVQSMDASSAVVQVTPTSPITFAHQAAGGDAGVMGPSTSAETCVDRTFGGRYCERSYQHGGIYWNLSTRAHRVTAPVYGPYIAAGGAAGSWGLPTTDTTCGLVEDGCVQKFQYRTWAMSPGTGAFSIRDAIATHWQAWGAESGTLGYPLADQTCTAGTCEQRFQRGTVVSASAGTFSVLGTIRDAWAASGASAGPLGQPTTVQGCGMVRGGCGQQFQNGSVYWSPATGAHAVTGPIWQLWTRNGWERGVFGFASADMVCGLTGGGCRQEFEGGTATWSPATGAQFTSGAIGAAWVAGGRESGALGYPSLPMGCGLPSSGCGQQFQGGSVYWTPTAGAHAVTGPIWDLWTGLGWERGPLRYASGDQVCGLAGGGCRQAFQGGTATWSPATGAQFTNGAIGAAWVAGGRESGALGYPSLPMGCGLPSSGCGQQFQGGSVYWTPTAGAHAVTGPIWQYWMSSGWERGPLGYATTDLDCTLTGGGCRQDFTGGSVFSSSSGTYATYGAVRAHWLRQGAEKGALGFPDGEMACGSSSCSQSFERGTLIWSPVAGVQVVTDAIRAAWVASGGDAGPLKGALAPASCGLPDNGCTQTFQGGTVTFSTTTGAWATYGIIRAHWLGRGGADGSLGYPIAEMTCGPDSCSQNFQLGVLEWTPANGVQRR